MKELIEKIDWKTLGKELFRVLVAAMAGAFAGCYSMTIGV